MAALDDQVAVAPSAVNSSTSSASTAATRQTAVRKPTNTYSTYGEVGRELQPSTSVLHWAHFVNVSFRFCSGLAVNDYNSVSRHLGLSQRSIFPESLHGIP